MITPLKARDLLAACEDREVFRQVTALAMTFRSRLSLLASETVGTSSKEKKERAKLLLQEFYSLRSELLSGNRRAQKVAELVSIDELCNAGA